MSFDTDKIGKLPLMIPRRNNDNKRLTLKEAEALPTGSGMRVCYSMNHNGEELLADFVVSEQVLWDDNLGLFLFRSLNDIIDAEIKEMSVEA